LLWGQTSYTSISLHKSENRRPNHIKVKSL
jgi:hypothetical protein